MPFLSQIRKVTSIEKLQADESKINLMSKSSYFISYPEFLKYFGNLEAISRHNLIIGSNFTYGWMPTILDLNSGDIEDVVSSINTAKRGSPLDIGQLEQIGHCLNKSMVGASKLLHFVNPHKYAIWDSRVYSYLTESTPHHYRLNDANSYLDYLQFCAEITSLAEYEPIHKSMIQKVGYEMTRFRTVELIMYLSKNSLGVSDNVTKEL